MKKQTILKITSLCMLALIAALFVPQAVYFASTFSDHAGAALAAAPLVTMFTKEIETKLYPENEFYMNSKDDSSWIKGDKVVRGVSGNSPGVQTNPIVPLTATQRLDDSNEYNIQLHVSDPQILTRDEELIVNYNKRSSILQDHADTLNTRIADQFAYTWAPTASGVLIRTTGASKAVSDPGQTGTRKVLEKQQFIDAYTVLLRQNAKGNKYALVPATLYGQLLAIPDFVDYTKTGRADVLAKGLIGEITGIKIYVRSYAVGYTEAPTPVKKAVGSAMGATDNLSILIWDETMVTRALGKANVNIENRPATYLGDIINSDVRAGGNLRKDGIGVVSIVQSA